MKPLTALVSSCLLLLSVPLSAAWTDSIDPEADYSVTGVVTYVHHLHCTATVADPSDPNGRAVYASGKVPYNPPGELVGCERLAIGDLVLIKGHGAEFLLEPGLKVRRMERIGSMDLPPPAETRYADLATGECNNRRVRVKGVLRSVTLAADRGRDLFLLTLGMSDGILVVRTGEDRDWSSLVDAEISVDGVVFPLINNRFEFLLPELESVGKDSVQVLSEPPGTIPEVRIDGSMSRARKTYDRHRCRVVGEVTERSADGRGFIIQRAGTALAVHCLDEAPLIGMRVEAIGFPQMENEVAGIFSAKWTDLPGSDVRAIPMDITLANFSDYQVGVKDLAKVDLCNRLVRIRAKLLNEPIVDNGRIRLDLEADGYQFFATIPLDRAADLVNRLEDIPYVEVTGVLRFEFVRSPRDARYRSLGSVELRMRTADDVVVFPDSGYRWRRMVRLSHAIGLWALIPLCLFPLLVAYFRIHRRLRMRALMDDRRRIAHELHDSISQHMAGAKLLLDTVRSNPGTLSGEQLAALSAADGVLGEARREMREAILDLQNDDLLLRTLKELLERFAAELNASGKVRARLKLREAPSALSPEVKRDLLAIVREAASNAIRHGGARNVIVVTDPAPGEDFTMGIYNDGAPFDPDKVDGPEKGHFGLTGIRERALRCGLSVEFVRTGALNGLRLAKERSREKV